MIPIRDDIRPSRAPVVTVLLIVLNVAVFGWQMGLGAGTEAAVIRLAVVPDRLVAAITAGLWFPQVGTVFTSMFLHGDLLHLLGNVWFLWIFGDNVEDRLGRLGFAGFYLLCGGAAAMSQVAAVPDSGVPMIGASGAIAGVLGAYLRFYPRARVLTVVPIFVFLHFMDIPALAFLGIWFVIQVMSSALGYAGVAWWAHMAGFAVGLVIALLVPTRPHAPRPPDPRVRRRAVAW